MHTNRLAYCLACLACLTTLAACSTLPAPPATPVQVVQDRYHGQLVDDPYRWLEAVERPEVQGWMRAQTEHTRQVLGRIPGREALLARMLEVENGAPARVSRVSMVASGAVFMLRKSAGAAQPQLIMRSRLDAPEHLVVDPAQFGPRHAIDYFIPSPDGRFVAYGVSEAGSEQTSLRLRDVDAGRDIVGPIADAKFNGASPYRWAADGSVVYFQTLRDRSQSDAKSELFQWPRVWRLAARAGAQPELVADGRHGIGPARSAHEHMARLHFGRSAWEVAFFEDGVRRDLRALVRPAGAAPSAAWTPLIAHADGIWQFALQGDRVYALTHKGSARFRVVSTPVAAPDWSSAQLVLPEGAGVVREIAAVQDALYASVHEGGRDRLLRVPYDGGPVQEIALPFPGSLRLAGHHADRPGVLVELSGWTHATQVYAVASGATTLQRTTLQPEGRFDHLDGVGARIEHAASHDGTLVPLSIVERSDRTAQRRVTAPQAPWEPTTRPTIIVAYGAYGLNQEPRLRAEWVPWLERGYVMATCHVRGGGEYGDAWYQAGRKQTKPNSWKDLIACAEHLVRTGVTTPRQLGIMGWSAGGITVGRALTERPDLFGAAAPGVGVLDAVRAETESNGPGNVVEFGSVAKADEFRALLAMSAYHHVRPVAAAPPGVTGVRVTGAPVTRGHYPAVILPHGATDQRVAVWHSSKMAAALQAADPATPVLLNIDFAAGHGRGSSTQQRLSTFADSIAFMLWRFGEPGFELR